MTDRLSDGFAGWTLAIITPDAKLEAAIGYPVERTAPLYNGKILTQTRVFRVPAPASFSGGCPAGPQPP